MNWGDLQNETTENLIEFIKYKEQADYRELAEAAFIAFTFRFSKEIIDKCRKIGKKWDYDNATADMIAEKAFDKFWKYPFGFDKNRCGGVDMNNCVIIYFLRIIKRCFFDHYKEISGQIVSPYDGNESVIVEFPTLEHLEIPEEKANDVKKVHDLIENALARLSPKHKIIYLTYKAYEKEGYKLPRHLLKKLREELDVTQNTIRVYKNEAFQTVDQYLKLYGSK